MQDEAVYEVAMPSFLADNQDRIAFQFQKRSHQVGIPDYECAETHFIANNPINIGIEGRIIIDYEENLETTTKRNSAYLVYPNFMFVLFYSLCKLMLK